MSSDDQVITHKRVCTNGIYLHVAEKGHGHGPPVLLIHGFPETWLSWSNQIHHLAQHGYRVIVPDLRGYGDSDSPSDPASYTVLHIVGDLIGLLDELGVDKAYVVGHDWGAILAWMLCLFRPDRVKGLVNLGIPYRPQSQDRPSDLLNKAFGDGLYITQFQEPGRAEKSFSQYDCLTVLKKLLLINAPDLLIAPPGVEIIDFLETPTSLPSWVPEEELGIIASTFEKNGFTAPLNYYRAMDKNWELLGPWQGAKIDVPTKLIIGDKDMGVQSLGTLDYVKGEEFRSIVPNLDVVIIDGHHYIQLENAQLVNDEIVSFLRNQASV
ncbi:epoxide hydrolase 1-like [Silene latifolia]|uniref:epoxide hydrolase 1-like n=1 Tax=Silene latifolia TaxID=37657 RepID=UPI003D772EA8